MWQTTPSARRDSGARFSPQFRVAWSPLMAIVEGLSDERAARFMIALRRGATPGMFGTRLRCIDAYCTINPAYAQEARPLLEANARAARYRKGNTLRSTTHCRAGLHLMTGDNVFFDGTHGRRRCVACRKASSMQASLMSTEVAEKVKLALQAGASLGQITGGKPLGGGKINRSLVITSRSSNAIGARIRILIDS